MVLLPASEVDEHSERKGGIKNLFSAKAYFSFRFFPYFIYAGPCKGGGGGEALTWSISCSSEDCRQHLLPQHVTTEQWHRTEICPC